MSGAFAIVQYPCETPYCVDDAAGIRRAPSGEGQLAIDPFAATSDHSRLLDHDEGVAMTGDQAGRADVQGVEAFQRIVTVSREFGAGGARVAGRVAAELGFQLWDQELVSHVARKAELEPHVVRDVDERGRDMLEEVLAASLPGQISGSKYRSLLTRAVSELADRGGAVIVGRGANFLIPSEKALRVRVVCPIRKRIDRYAAASRLDAEAAERFVLGKDREREKFVQQLCGERSADALHYDLVVNTGDLSEQAAAQLIITTYHARFGALGRVSRASSLPPQVAL